jgi:hypothetical protein
VVLDFVSNGGSGTFTKVAMGFCIVFVVAANFVVAGPCVSDSAVVFWGVGLQFMGGRVVFVTIMAWDTKSDCFGNDQGGMWWFDYCCSLGVMV